MTQRISLPMVRLLRRATDDWQPLPPDVRRTDRTLSAVFRRRLVELEPQREKRQPNLARYWLWRLTDEGKRVCDG